MQYERLTIFRFRSAKLQEQEENWLKALNLPTSLKRLETVAADDEKTKKIPSMPILLNKFIKLDLKKRII